MKINVERAKAVLTIIVTAIVNIINVYGYAVDSEPLVNAVTTILSAITIVYAWWKNQNITHEAIESQKVLDAMKSIRKETGEQVSVNMALELTGGADHDNE